MEPALQAALDAIAALPVRPRLSDDPILVRLRAIKARISRPYYAPGMAGGRQVFTELTGVEAVQKARVRVLTQGRQQQIAGGSARAELARSAELRRRIVARSTHITEQKAA